MTFFSYFTAIYKNPPHQSVSLITKYSKHTTVYSSRIMLNVFLSYIYNYKPAAQLLQQLIITKSLRKCQLKGLYHKNFLNFFLLISSFDVYFVWCRLQLYVSIVPSLQSEQLHKNLSDFTDSHWFSQNQKLLV